MKSFRTGLFTFLMPFLVALIIVAGTAPLLGQSRDDASRATVEAIRARMYDGENHRYVKLWDSKNIATVEVKGAPGKVVWFNPHVSIPELGIVAGQSLTPAQEAALVRLFCVRIAKPGEGDGTAAHPVHAGRAVNTNPYSINLVLDNGEVIPDIVIKGVGSTRSSMSDFNLDKSEALIDAELSRSLYEAGVRNYNPIVVITPDSRPSSAVYVRGPTSMLRYEDFDRLSDAELKATLDILREDYTRVLGKPRLMSVREWAGEFLPYTTGRNAGMLSALGVRHGSIYGRDNHGLAETVDWGWVELGHVDSDAQKDVFWTKLEDTIARINRALGPGEQIDAKAARNLYEKGYGDGKQHVKSRGISLRLHSRTIAEADDSDLRTLLSGYGVQDVDSMYKPRLLKELENRGILVANEYKAYLKCLDDVELRRIAALESIANAVVMSGEEIVDALIRKRIANTVISLKPQPAQPALLDRLTRLVSRLSRGLWSLGRPASSGGRKSDKPLETTNLLDSLHKIGRKMTGDGRLSGRRLPRK